MSGVLLLVAGPIVFLYSSFYYGRIIALREHVRLPRTYLDPHANARTLMIAFVLFFEQLVLFGFVGITCWMQLDRTV